MSNKTYVMHDSFVSDKIVGFFYNWVLKVNLTDIYYISHVVYDHCVYRN